MPRHSERDIVIAAIEEYLSLAQGGDDRTHPLDVVSVARVIRKGRTTLYKYGVPALLKAARESRRRSGRPGPRARERQAYEELAADQAGEIEVLESRTRGLVARLTLVEANATRLGIDPEELYRPLVKPDRRLSRAGRGLRPRRA